MTPADMQILKCLVAVAWADGVVESPEVEVIDQMLDLFGASEAEAKEVRDYASVKRTLQDIPLEGLSSEDREVLLGNAAVLSHADGAQTKGERKLLTDLIARLGINPERAKAIIDGGKDGVLLAGTRGLLDE
jgi:tellurite resistance protein